EMSSKVGGSVKVARRFDDFRCACGGVIDSPLAEPFAFKDFLCRPQSHRNRSDSGGSEPRHPAASAVNDHHGRNTCNRKIAMAAAELLKCASAVGRCFREPHLDQDLIRT